MRHFEAEECFSASIFPMQMPTQIAQRASENWYSRFSDSVLVWVREVVGPCNGYGKTCPYNQCEVLVQFSDFLDMPFPDMERVHSGSQCNRRIQIR